MANARRSSVNLRRHRLHSAPHPDEDLVHRETILAELDLEPRIVNDNGIDQVPLLTSLYANLVETLRELIALRLDMAPADLSAYEQDSFRNSLNTLEFVRNNIEREFHALRLVPYADKEFPALASTALARSEHSVSDQWPTVASTLAFLQTRKLIAAWGAADLSTVATEVPELLGRLRAADAEAKVSATSVRESVGDVLRGSAIAEFTRLMKAHRLQERLAGASCLLIAVGIGAVIKAIIEHAPPQLLATLPASGSTAASPQLAVWAHYIVSHLLLLGTVSVAFRVGLRKYNLERNLRIIYDHRISVLQQFGRILGEINPEQADVRERLRLEMTKYVFTDPITGYLQDSASDVNISPVVNVLESVGKRVSAS